MRNLKIEKQITSRETLSMQKYLTDVSPYPLLSQDEEIEITKRIRDGDEKAVEILIKSNLRFVISVAKQYPGTGEELNDLINSGNIGLIIAAKKFDHTKGFRFISYAVWWIRQSIMQYLTENSKSIRLPANKVGVVNKIKNITSSLEQSLQRRPTPEEIGEALLASDPKKGLDLDASEIDRIIAASSPVSSLDIPLGEESESTLADLLITDTPEDVNVSIKKSDINITLKRILAKRLPVREREIIIHSFGLFGEAPKTLEEIGLILDLTRERVRQLREGSLRRLKHANCANLLKEFI